MIDEAALVAALDDMVGRHETVGLAVGVVGPEGLRSFHGRGLADLASERPITEDTVFRIASITKTFTAIAVMQLVERGLVELDAPAADYLRELRLVPADAGHRPATVRHLLTHTGGLGELAHLSGLVRPDFGESVPAEAPMPTLAEFYGGGIRLKAEPGTSFTYGNQSPAVLGQLVEDVTGSTLEMVFRESIFEPLGMPHSDLLRSDLVRAHMATGYEPGRNGWKVVEERDMITAGAASVYSTTADMARYAAALLGGGANEHGHVLEPRTVAQMYAPHYQPDPRIPGMGLGFFREEVGGHAVVEHQGVHPGFHSHLCLAPEDGVGVVAFTNGARDPVFWLSTEVRGVLAAAVGADIERAPRGLELAPERRRELAGWYQLSGPWSNLRQRAFMGAGGEVFERGDRLMLRFLTPIPELYRGFPLTAADPADPDVLMIDLGEAGVSRVVVDRDAAAVSGLHLGMMPITLHRRPGATNPRRWAKGLLVLAAAGVVALVLGRLART